MNVGELIEKLSKLPPSAIVVTDDNEVFGYTDADVYRFQAVVKRHNNWHSVYDDNGRDSVETVVLITMFGHDDKEEL